VVGGDDSVGEPTRAAVSFAKKQGVALHEVFVITTPKGEYLAAKQVRRGRTTEQILADILPRAVHDLAWPRSMTWTGLDGPRFIRPNSLDCRVARRQTAKADLCG